MLKSTQPTSDQPDAGVMVREALNAVLAEMVDRYCAEHYDGQPIHEEHLAALTADPKGQVEDFIYYACRQPEVISFNEGKIYTLDRPTVVEIDPETGAETTPDWMK